MVRKILIKIVDILKTILPSWIKPDKVLHFGVSFIGAFIESFFLVIPTHTIMAGILKELFDEMQSNNKFDLSDLVADGLGIIAGVSAKYFVNWLF
jgi:hypothetical protein